MSQGHERNDKDCLNCGAFVQGHFCQNCGQKNIEPSETFFGLVRHFFEDITHFDGKFFSTLKYLIVRPGFLSNEYVTGKRTKYLHPVRMYVFTSALFFLFFFAVGGFEKKLKSKFESQRDYDRKEMVVNELAKDYLKDSSGKLGNIEKIRELTDSSKTVTSTDLLATIDRHLQGKDLENLKGELKNDEDLKKVGERLNQGEELTVTGAERGWALDYLITLMHRLPYMLFFSLPVVAFVLYLLYIRNKQLFYFHHAIFSIHLFIFFFILAALLTLCVKYAFLDWLFVPLFLAGNVYTLIAIKKFYGQSWKKTILKYCIMVIAGIWVLSMVLGIFALAGLKLRGH